MKLKLEINQIMNSAYNLSAKTGNRNVPMALPVLPTDKEWAELINSSQYHCFVVPIVSSKLA